MAQPLPDLRHTEETDEKIRLRFRQDGSEEPVTITGFTVGVRVFRAEEPATTLLQALSSQQDGTLTVIEASATDTTNRGRFDWRILKGDLRGLAPAALRWQVFKFLNVVEKMDAAEPVGEGVFELLPRGGGTVS